MKVNGHRNCLVNNIVQNIFLHVTQEKESHTGLERHDGFLVNYPSKFHFEIISPLNMR